MQQPSTIIAVGMGEEMSRTSKGGSRRTDEQQNAGCPTSRNERPRGSKRKHLPVNKKEKKKKAQCDLSCEKMYEPEQQSIVSPEGSEAEDGGTMGGIRLWHAISGVKAVQMAGLRPKLSQLAFLIYNVSLTSDKCNKQDKRILKKEVWFHWSHVTRLKPNRKLLELTRLILLQTPGLRCNRRGSFIIYSYCKIPH